MDLLTLAAVTQYSTFLFIVFGPFIVASGMGDLEMMNNALKDKNAFLEDELKRLKGELDALERVRNPR